MEEGAVLCLPIQAKGENTVARTKFGKWIISHIDRWFAWARQLELGVERMEDSILVTGTHRTRSWTNVAFPGGQGGAQALFGSKADHRGDVVSIHWQFSHEHNRGVVLNCGLMARYDPIQLVLASEILKYLSCLIHARTCRRISVFSYEGFAPLVGLRSYRRGLREPPDPIQTQRDMTGQMQNSYRYLLYQR